MLQEKMIPRLFLVFGVLALPAPAQSESWERLARGSGLASRIEFDLGAPAAQASALPAPDPRLSVAAGAAETPPPSDPLDRSDLEGPVEAVPFRAVPGGIVLGTAATTRGDWTGFELALDQRGLALVTATGRHYLPEARPELILACIEFVLRGDGSDVVIDIDELGTEMTPELEGTSLAPALIRADGAPHRWLVDLPMCKTVILDDAIRFDADPTGGDLVISASLAVRIYVPLGGNHEAPSLISSARILGETRSGTGTVCSALDAPHGLAVELEPVIDLAGVLGVLRWAAERDPGCLDDVLRRARPAISLASSELFSSRSTGGDWPRSSRSAARTWAAVLSDQHAWPSVQAATSRD